MANTEMKASMRVGGQCAYKKFACTTMLVGDGYASGVALCLMETPCCQSGTGQGAGLQHAPLNSTGGEYRSGGGRCVGGYEAKSLYFPPFYPSSEGCR